MNVKVVALFIGGFNDLPFKEFISVLHSLSVNYKIISHYKRVIIATVPEWIIKHLCNRLALTKIIGYYILDSAKFEDALEKFKSKDLPIGDGEKVAIKVWRIEESFKELSSIEIARTLGEILHKRGYKIDLEDPDHVIWVILTKDRIVILSEIYLFKASEFDSRRPKNRPVFHPSTMEPRIAKALVNLSTMREDDIMIDPFCGVGGILLEAGLMKGWPIGLDIDWRMCKGAIINLRYYGVWRAEVLCCDALFPPIRKCDVIVTDPPYGRGASTRGRSHSELLKGSLSNLINNMPKRIVVISNTRDVEKLFKELSLYIEYYYEHRIHKSLTRIIYVLVPKNENSISRYWRDASN